MISSLRRLTYIKLHNLRNYSLASTANLQELGDFRTHDELHRFSLENPDRFWGPLASKRIKWIKPYEEVSRCSFENGVFQWYLGGRLNIADNCVDRHALKNPNNIALIWEKDEPGQNSNVTYRELLEMTCKAANVLKAHGVVKGDRVAIYMPNYPMTVAVMLACMRIGALHSVVFAGFSAEALSSRIQDAACKVVITTDQAVRGGKIIDLKKVVDAAVACCPTVKRVLVANRTGADVKMSNIDVSLDKMMEQASADCPLEVMESEDPSFMLYTSGSTGKPKGLVHSTAGYLMYASLTHQAVFNVAPGDVFACVADVGWITGHSYVVYGPLANGVTTVLFESIPTYPDPGRYWEMVDRLKVNQFYTSPTAVRLLLKAGDEWPEKYKLSSLKTLGCVGEPLNHEAWVWYHEKIGRKRCDIVDTWWQTETGGICISPRPSAPDAIIRPGMPMRPFFGIQPVLMDENKKEIAGNDAVGPLCIKYPWPGMARTIYGDHERFLKTYFKPYPGYYFTGDGAHRHADGHYQITGRTDDVINVSGHRLGTAEIEDALDEHEAVAESAVIGFPHSIKGEGIYAFITLKDHNHEAVEEVKQDLKSLVAKMIAKFAVPDNILVVPGLPKTRSGKIMRRILKKIAAGERKDLGDITTLADPTVVAEIVRLHAESSKKQ